MRSTRSSRRNLSRRRGRDYRIRRRRKKMNLMRPRTSTQRRDLAKDKIKQRILRGVAEANKRLREEDADTPEKAYDRAMRGV